MSRRIAEYDVVRPTRELVSSLDGTQEGDPDRAADILVGVVAMRRPPLRVPLAGDAFEVITSALGAIDDNIRRWEGVA